jgi:23S rRNA (adenine2503-C2)-methyltransferase
MNMSGSYQKTFLLDMNLDDLRLFVNSLNQPAYRAIQIWEGIYHSHWTHFDQFTSLPVRLREELKQRAALSQLTVHAVQQSRDNQTLKTLFRLPDTSALEAVLMRYPRRNTLCISTQSGCAMGCVFCATGQMGFRRNLSSGHIVEQVLYYSRLLSAEGQRVTNIVMMGMGEPFHNYDQTMDAIQRLNDPQGYNFGQRRFTISTVGLIPQIYKFADENSQVNLAVSLHAADDVLRSSMLPVNNRYPLKELLRACRYYVQKTNRRITFEWALINNVNDTPEQVEKLSTLLSGLLCHVNVIPLNPTNGYHGEASTGDRAQAFKQRLEQSGIPCSIRTRRGIDIQAGCGQLATQVE